MLQFMGSERAGHSLVTEQWPTAALHVCSVWATMLILDSSTCDWCGAALIEPEPGKRDKL